MCKFRNSLGLVTRVHGTLCQTTGDPPVRGFKKYPRLVPNVPTTEVLWFHLVLEDGRHSWWNPSERLHHRSRTPGRRVPGERFRYRNDCTFHWFRKHHRLTSVVSGHTRRTDRNHHRSGRRHLSREKQTLCDGTGPRVGDGHRVRECTEMVLRQEP